MRNYFPGLIGNEETKNRIGRAIESGTLPHAFLIGGPSGSGKSTLATEMAAALNCESRNTGDGPLPCGRCSNCRRIYDESYPDVKILRKKKDKATLGVEPVKDFREDMFLSSTESEHKIYVIDDAECMTPEAQNALLKVLEEPPGSVMILLLAKECDRILTTIKSRAQYIAMDRFDDDRLAELMLNESSEARMMKSTNPERFMTLIMNADGRIGPAKAMMAKRNSQSDDEREDIIKLLCAIGQKASYAEIYTSLSGFPSKRVELSATLERLMSAIRDLIVIKKSKDAKTVFFTSAEDARTRCGDISTLRLVAVYDTVKNAHELCARNANLPNLMATLASGIRLAAGK